MARRIDLSNPMPRAQGIEKRKADIVFCIDSTGSMRPCIDGVKHNLNEFVLGLQTTASVDFRLRLVSYRDLHDSTSPGPPWLETDFTNSMFVEPFLTDIGTVRAAGGGDLANGESTLDALYRAITWSDWREGECQRCIVLLTDEDTHPTLHPSTYTGPLGDIRAVVSELQNLPHPFLCMFVPDYPLYREIVEQAVLAHGKGRLFVQYVGSVHDKESHRGLDQIDWKRHMRFLGQSISIASVSVR
jgi:hypothetical protein